MTKTEKIALNVERNDEGGLGVILASKANMTEEAMLTEEDAFVLAAGIRIDDKAAVPPISADIIEKMMDDAVAERCGDNLADDWVMDDESHTAARDVTTANNAVAELGDIRHVIELETMLVKSFALTFAGDLVGAPEFFEKKVFEISHFLALGCLSGWSRR